MRSPMGLRPTEVAAPLLAALAVALVAITASPAVSTAGSSACGKFGGQSPHELTNGQARDTILCLLNDERDDAGLRALDRSKKLQKAAQRHNERMDGTGCFAHQCPGEASLTTRLESVDYLSGGLTRWMYGEAIAWGMKDRGTPKAIVSAWMHSPPHRALILNRTFDEAGVGFSPGTPQSRNGDGGIFTTDFGFTVG